MEKAKQWGVLAIVFILAAALVASCSGGSSSSSGKKWSDLSDVEKENARWAYEAQQAIDDK